VGYNTSIAIVWGKHPRHVEDAWAEYCPGEPIVVRTAPEVPQGEVPAGAPITLADYGSAIIEFDLKKVGENDLEELFQSGRDHSRGAAMWPYYFPVTGDPDKGMRVDHYNQPLSVHSIGDVLEALEATMDERKASGKRPYHRFVTLKAILDQMILSGAYGELSVLSYGH